MPLLRQACPGFEPAWQGHLEWWKGEEAGAYNDAAVFAHYIVESYERRDLSEFPSAFAAIEKILSEGDQEARDIAGIGVIEDIQTIGSNRSYGADVFKQWLGPLSRQAWREIEQMWEGKESLMDLLRSERRTRTSRWWQFWK